MGNYLTRDVGRMNIVEFFVALVLLFAVLWVILWIIQEAFKVPKDKRLSVWSPITVGGKTVDPVAYHRTSGKNAAAAAAANYNTYDY